MFPWYDPFPVLIEPADLGEADELAEIHATGFHRGWSPPEVEALLVQDRMIALVGRRGSLFGSRRPVGFVLVRKAGDEAEVLTLVVSPHHRRRGIAARLMDEAMRRLYAERVRSLFLEVDEGNAAAIGLYRRLGFREVGRRDNYYARSGGPAGGALVMRADIS
ncbi:GNAT family N-acetyltransferase [Methylobrevis pamukkalensis]|uniref:Ribosomal-protein-alanine N-acetyltransferase n=1 Tax=Methylobrevis pamukkalensis TaxID=1439726 RepID=A0A1E3H9H7_9HYPH|nr:GNAT family N-acetyltransferase [Methylobrevis pamukkalensis]ODN72141.1 ribosomal-protein-alanine N-acetyltransferase [Methylobrevis pamukkalensis]